MGKSLMASFISLGVILASQMVLFLVIWLEMLFLKEIIIFIKCKKLKSYIFAKAGLP